MTSIDQTCADVYRQVHHLWVGLEGTLPTWQHKYSILYGPPVERPSMFIIGYNPGGGADQELETTWPSELWYTQDRQARMQEQLQDVFSAAGLGQELERSAGANLTFFRSPGIAKRMDGSGWKDVPAALRQPLEKYCRLQLNRLIEAMHPDLLFLMGWDVLDAFVPDKHYDAQLIVDGKKWLAVRATSAAGRPIIGVRHPTGGYGWSAADRETIARWLSEQIPPLLTSA